MAENLLKNGCSPVQMAMIDAYMAGSSKTEAFTAAFPERAAKSTRPAGQATREFAKKAVVEEVARREAARDAALKEAAMGEAERVTELWSREDSVRRLLEIADACRERRREVDEYGCLIMDRDGIAAARLERDTVDSLNKMLGYDAPVRLEQDQSLTVRFASDPGAEDWMG